MNELEIIKQLEYLIAFQNNCLNNGDWENFDKSENAIKRLEEALVNSKKRDEIKNDKKLKNMLESLETVSSY